MRPQRLVTMILGIPEIALCINAHRIKSRNFCYVGCRLPAYLFWAMMCRLCFWLVLATVQQQHRFSFSVTILSTPTNYLLATIRSPEVTLRSLNRLVSWVSSRMLVFDQRAFAVLRSAYSWQVTTYVGKPSAVGQPTRLTQPFILWGR